MRFSLFLLLIMPLCADPWGKDADLAYKKIPPIVKPTCRNFLVSLSETLVDFHQEVISPADGPRSHFIPSSSQYAMDAIHKYGFFKGFAMGCDRLMRENADPWVYRETLSPEGYKMKYDPVP